MLRLLQLKRWKSLHLLNEGSCYTLDSSKKDYYSDNELFAKTLAVGCDDTTISVLCISHYNRSAMDCTINDN